MRAICDPCDVNDNLRKFSPAGNVLKKCDGKKLFKKIFSYNKKLNKKLNGEYKSDSSMNHYLSYKGEYILKVTEKIDSSLPR